MAIPRTNMENPEPVVDMRARSVGPGFGNPFTARGIRWLVVLLIPIGLGLALLLIPIGLWAQNPRHVITSHPRMWLNNTIADTWDPTNFPGGGTNGRLAAIVSRICGNSSCSVAGTSATAYADFQGLLTLAPTAGSGLSGFSIAAEGGLATMQAYEFVYLVFHTLGNDTLANPYAAS